MTGGRQAYTQAQLANASKRHLLDHWPELEATQKNHSTRKLKWASLKPLFEKDHFLNLNWASFWFTSATVQR